MAPSRYDFSCCWDTKHKQTNNQINKRKQKKNTQFQHDVLRDNKYGMGSGSILLNLEAPKRVPGI